MLVYHNGCWLEESKVTILLLDHGYLFGYGLFETLACFKGRVLYLKEHLQRLKKGLKILKIPLDVDNAAIQKAIYQTLKLNGLTQGYVKLLISPVGWDLGADALYQETNFFIIAKPHQLYPKKYYTHGAKAYLVDNLRIHHDYLSQVKMLNYGRPYFARKIAKNKKVVDVLMKDVTGHPVEGSSSNLFIINDKNHILTPPLSSGILAGVTRDKVMLLCKRLKMPIHEKLFSTQDLFNAKEVFITSSLKQIMPITRINGKKIGSGKVGAITQQLIKHFNV
ncbi:MAG: aminotransferase class IV family protein [Deltaproteobacteria bacterium]|nr:aminotransferase class IV family protein [Deltaproteobacteria bacterium]